MSKQTQNLLQAFETKRLNYQKSCNLPKTSNFTLFSTLKGRYFTIVMNLEEFMDASCKAKQAQMKDSFAPLKDEEQKYERIIQMGRELPKLSPEFKIPANIVKGCQSTVYLRSYLKEGNVYFQAESDALISSGLAAILLHVYNGEPPEVILKCPPDYLEELGISSSLTPNRANGLYSIHLRMKQEALRLLMETHRK